MSKWSFCRFSEHATKLSHRIRYQFYFLVLFDFLFFFFSLLTLSSPQFLNETGGILDDTMVSKRSEDHLFIVVNASNVEQDLGILSNAVQRAQSSGMDVTLEFLSDRSLLAVQGSFITLDTFSCFSLFSDDNIFFFKKGLGSRSRKTHFVLTSSIYCLDVDFKGPKAVDVVASLSNDSIRSLPFMSGVELDIGGFSTLTTRCGYTGEDGFEVTRLIAFVGCCVVFLFVLVFSRRLISFLSISHPLNPLSSSSFFFSFSQVFWELSESIHDSSLSS